jgi:hypothetical protein
MLENAFAKPLRNPKVGLADVVKQLSQIGIVGGVLGE